jgi:hypothetical protein
MRLPLWLSALHSRYSTGAFMAEPTQAQIEAAKSIYRLHCIRHNKRFDWEQSVQSMWIGYAKAAIDAAAQAEDDKDWAHAAAMAANRKPDAFVDAVRAIRHVGGLTLEYTDKDSDDVLEQCAQVLEAAYAECETLNLLHGAARLRALRDKI